MLDQKDTLRIANVSVRQALHLTQAVKLRFALPATHSPNTPDFAEYRLAFSRKVRTLSSP